MSIRPVQPSSRAITDVRRPNGGFVANIVLCDRVAALCRAAIRPRSRLSGNASAGPNTIPKTDR
ncbi:MAG: hypothetical protein H0X67_13135 [Acidobacteria bacterium]|nr:hypothetical protein [Acidobacteriota bacterium]